MAMSLWTDESVRYVVGLAWEYGRHFERLRIAEAQAELEACWRPIGRVRYEESVAERVALFEEHARRLATRLAEQYGRVPWMYAGGPVDFETGRPLRGEAAE